LAAKSHFSAGPPERGLLRSIRRWDLVAVTINGVIGAGIFGLPSRAFALAGGYSIFAFCACAFFVGLIVLSFAEVGSRFSGTGGPYLYAREAFGPAAGFQVGWLMYLARLTAFAANCNLLVEYLAWFQPAAGAGAGRAALMSLIVAALTIVNVAGVRKAAVAGDVFTVGKLLPLAVFIGLGFFAIDPARFSFDSPPDYGSFSKAVLLLVYAFTGFEMAVIPAGETRDPRRTLPAAILLGMAIVAVFYVLIQAVAIGTLPGLAASQRPLADASQAFLGPAGAALISAGAAVSILGNLNVVILAASRLVFAMAERNELPGSLAYLHHTYRTPVAAIVVTSAAMLVLALSGTFIYLLTISTISRLVVYFITCGSLPILRRREAALPGAFHAPAGRAVSIAAMVLSLWLLSHATWNDVRDTAVAAVFGLAVFVISAVRRGERREKRRKTSLRSDR
jgi:amino acid transporter